MPLSAADRIPRGWALHRSITLLRVFLVASAAILLAGALALTWTLTSTLQHEAIIDAQTSLTQYVDGVLRPQLVRHDRLRVAPTLPSTIAAQLRRQRQLEVVKVWRPDGVL